MLNYRPLHSGSVDRARQLRRDASEPERRLLRAVREAFPAHKWRHQSPVGPYYIDILCLAERLAIEVDGDTHAHSESYDATRTKFIQREGFRVVRFSNSDVMENLEGVVTQISLSLREREGAPQARKGEGDVLASRSPRAASRLAQHRVNSAPRCSDHAGGMIDPMLPQGEGK